jgi:hypothetical protein
MVQVQLNCNEDDIGQDSSENVVIFSTFGARMIHNNKHMHDFKNNSKLKDFCTAVK